MKRALGGLLATFAGGVLFSASAMGAEWSPTRPVKIIVPYNAGAAADMTARLLGEKLAPALGQAVIVENRGGAGGIIGTAAAASSSPDGHTLVLGTDANFTIAPQLQQVPYDPLKDFRPVTIAVNLPLVLVVNPQKVSSRTVAELVAHTKAQPGKLVFASSGNGSSHHLALELLQKESGAMDVGARLAELGYVLVGTGPDAMGRRIRGNYQQFGKLIREGNIKAD